jgi:hypothetical protein
VIVAGASQEMNLDTDLDAILAELYLEPEEIAEQVKHVEILVRRCQELVAKGASVAAEQKQVEQEILWTFALKVMDNTVPPIEGIYIIDGGKSKQVSLRLAG